MSKSNFTYFILILVSILFVLPTINGQDSISIPDVPTPLINPPSPPTTITPETEQIPVTSEENSDGSTTTTIYYTDEVYEEVAAPVVVKKAPKVDKELLAALDGNPFGLIRDGKAKPSKKASEKLPLPTEAPPSTKEKASEATDPAEEVEPKQEETAFVPIDTTTVALESRNPFRLEGSAEDRQIGIKTKKIKFNPQAGTGAKNTVKKYNPIFDTSKVNVNPLGTLKFVFVIVLLGFLSFIVTRFQNEIADVYRAFLNGNLLSLLYREKGTILRLPYFLLYTLAALSFGIMIFLTTKLTGGEIFKSDFLSIITCIAGAGAIFALKHLTLSALSYVFPFKKEANLYGFTIAIFNFVIGIALIPFIILIAFAPEDSHTIILYIAIAITAFAYLFRTIRSLIIGNKYLIHNKFHFFMYLCTIEIAPLLILLKLIGL